MKIAIKWGVILGLAVIAWTLALHYLGFYTTNIAAGQRADVVATVLPVLAIMLALLQQRRTTGQLTIPDALRTALVVGVVSVPITAGFLWFYHHHMNPRWLEVLIDYQRERMTVAGASPEEIANAASRQRASGTDSAQLWGALLGSVIISTLLGLIGGLILRRRPRSTARQA